ncbi:probable nuclear pore complex protein NUP98A at C-terminar half [Coccomyxa sp. Obi]|nr:probable nuclear pore complex protein NUP98A at C-terminar half [Coccomyxa sp. Obi]
MENGDDERRSSWSSWVYTPLKALRESFLSKSPIKGDEVDDNVDGHVANQTASSTAAAVVEEGEAHSQKAGDQYSSREQEAGPSQPIDMALPAHVLGNLPSVLCRPAAVTPARPSGVSEGADSSYEDLLARNVALLSNSPLAAGSPFRPRARPGVGSQQPTPAQSSGAAGTPLGQAPLPMGSRPFHSVGPSRFGLRDGPAPSPLALTPAPQPFRATPFRGGRPFARTPIHMQPLSATVPASSTPAPAASAAVAPEPAPLSWTPMRTYSSMQPRGGAGLSLKRARPDGSPVGQPLLGAGLTGDSERRTRRRGEQGGGSAERRVWKAGQGPHKGPAGREYLAIEGPAATRASATVNDVAGSREPLPMTESARRIAMALDSMLPTSAPQGEAQPAATLAPQQPIPPPRDTLGVAPRPLPSAAPPPATSSLALPLTLHVDAFPNSAPFSWATQPPPAASVVQLPAKSGSDTQRPGLVPSAPPAASWSTWSSRPTISLPVDMDFTAGTAPSLLSPTPNPDSAPLPLTPVVPSLNQPSLFKFSGAQKVEIAGEERKAGTGAPEVAQAKFSFRPARSLLDSAEKIRTPSQPQPVIPTPEKVIAENDRAAAAASQPLPISDDDEDEDEEHQDGDGSEDGDIKGVMRSSARPKENGETPATTRAAAPVSSAGGWDSGFLKKNQAQAAAAAEAAEKAERGGAQSEAQPQASASKGGWDSGFLKQNHAQAAAASEAAQKAIEAERGGAQPEPQQQPSESKGGWDLAFLSANKAAADAATAAAKAEVDKAAGKSSSGPAPASFTISFGKPQTPATDTAASSGSGLLSFLGSVVPSSSSTAFAPSTSSGFTFGTQPAEASKPAATSALIPVAPAAKPLPSFLASSMPASHDATENGDVPASDTDAPAKKSKSDEAPAISGGFKFGGGALPFSFPPAASTSAEATAPAMPPGATEPGTAAATTDVTASAAASDAPASTPAPLSFGIAASNGPASLGFGAASQPASSSAAVSPAPFSFGALSAPPAAVSQPEAPAKAPVSFQLKPRAAPFTPAATAFNFGKPVADAGQQESQKDSQKPPDSEPAGLDITHAERGGSGRSLDSNMSVSPSAGAGASNPFVALEIGPTPEAPTTSGFPVPSFMAPPSAAAASSFTFGASAAAASASSSGFPSTAVGGRSLGFLSGSVPAFGAASTPAFGAAVAPASQPSSAPMGIFGAITNSGFGAPASTPAFGGSTPAFGAAASTPAFGATQPGALTFGTSSTPAFGASSTPVFGASSAPAFPASSTPAFGGSSMPAFGSSSTPAFGAGSAPAFGASNTAPFGQASAPAFAAGSAPAFGGFGGGGFGGGATPAFGGFGGGSGAFGAQPQGAAAPFGAAHTAPAWGAAATPTFGQPSAQANVDTAPGPFGAPAQPAFGLQQQQQAVPANPFGFQGALSGGLGGDAASGFTMGAGDSQQQQGQLARRKVKVKRKGPR